MRKGPAWEAQTGNDPGAHLRGEWISKCDYSQDVVCSSRGEALPVHVTTRVNVAGGRGMSEARPERQKKQSKSMSRKSEQWRLVRPGAVKDRKAQGQSAGAGSGPTWLLVPTGENMGICN